MGKPLSDQLNDLESDVRNEQPLDMAWATILLLRELDEIRLNLDSIAMQAEARAQKERIDT